MKIFGNLIRQWFPRYYCVRGFRRTEKECQRRLKAAGNLPADERSLLKFELQENLREWGEWLAEIDDKRLVAKAAKMDIDLDDIPLPPPEEHEPPSYYVLGNYGNRYLALETRKALKAKMREKAPSYRKERREFLDLIIKTVPFVIGLIGAAIGLVSAIKK